MSEDLRTAATRYTAGLPAPEGLHLADVEGIGFACARSPTPYVHALYRPLLCLVLQGAKDVTSGMDTWSFKAGETLIVGTDLAVSGRVRQASPTEPYLAVALGIDLALLKDLMGEMAAVPEAQKTVRVAVAQTQAAVQDCVARLVRLIETPDALAVLRPSILRELHYWLLRGPHGAMLSQLSLPDSHAARISRAVAVLRADYARPLPVDELAEVAGMSVSSFHAHFKAVTSLSPLQFQKRLRLVEARRRLHGEGLAIAEAAFDVGYESVSHFTRDYARLFGAPPGRDLTARPHREDFSGDLPPAAARRPPPGSRPTPGPPSP
ncbi:AraC family transcriptional regulator [Aquabacter sp. P-9]|uniref:AraC family transcriptional regulator n=1 Tax=Aquabacter sediminis TaxID=3029197 RepID=UPI00237D8E83|nr:AraC family transcriptional regulator [Aquabacter sp. P-9]MDE1566546.1 AraC family transcriptional regulator [Aquabacter sp. P-9]